MKVSVDSFIEAISDAQSTKDLLHIFLRVAAEFSFTEAAYCVVSKGGRRLPAKDGVRLATLPNAMRALIEAGEAVDFDPYVLIVTPQLRPFHWFEGEAIAGPAHKAIFKHVRNLGFVDGLAAPVTSGPGELAIFLLSRRGAYFNFTDIDRRAIAAICRTTHDRYEELAAIADAPSAPALTVREHEIMMLICNGASNARIASRLNISAHTVDSLIRRIFGKLAVNTRVEAALAYQALRPKRLKAAR